MAIHFTQAEFERRKEKALSEIHRRNLSALLMFRQESMYYLTGYDTFGYVFFQCLVLFADGRYVLLTRSPDLRQAWHTSIISDIRIWEDAPDADPVRILKSILTETEGRGARLGVEYDAYGLTAKHGKQLDAALEGTFTLVDASDLITRLRAVKSAAELEYVRKAAALADAAHDAALAIAGPGVDEGEILAAMHAAVFTGGGDDPANEFVIGSGPDALLCRYKTGRRRLGAVDQLTLEWCGVYRHYHAAMMRTLGIGEAQRRHRELYDVVADAMDACLEALKPGRPIGDVFAAYANTCDAAGMRAHRLNATGYSLGAVFAPNWMDWPMIYRDNPVIAEPNMVFFLHMVLMDSDTRAAMTSGLSVVVTETGLEVLSRRPLALVVNLGK
jgi:Xaa-Pro dipeptidase